MTDIQDRTDRRDRTAGDAVPLLQVRDLRVAVMLRSGREDAVRGVNLTLHRGETLAIVGESGSGKSLTALAIAGLLPRGVDARGAVEFNGTNLLDLSPRAMRGVRAKEIGFVFQDPLAALNPTMTVGAQVGEARRGRFAGESRRDRRGGVIEALESVQVPDPDLRADQYPHEFSGGMRQRAMIATARTKRPSLLIADEPTTALDVTVQAQVLKLIADAKTEDGVATVFISHDLALVSQIADRVAVMYGGRIVEEGTVEELFTNPKHPYTIGLLGSIARLDLVRERLVSIPGSPPALGSITVGCRFAPRCERRQGRESCVDVEPGLRNVGAPEERTGHRSACHFNDEAPRVADADQGEAV
tara:strand:+ start:149645 stop:150721 length:1077 start_codon:yes stop_codon:yes gene_type:complete